MLSYHLDAPFLGYQLKFKLQGGGGTRRIFYGGVWRDFRFGFIGLVNLFFIGGCYWGTRFGCRFKGLGSWGRGKGFRSRWHIGFKFLLINVWFLSCCCFVGICLGGWGICGFGAWAVGFWGIWFWCWGICTWFGARCIGYFGCRGIWFGCWGICRFWARSVCLWGWSIWIRCWGICWFGAR